jgi:hypothetical protein
MAPKLCPSRHQASTKEFFELNVGFLFVIVGIDVIILPSEFRRMTDPRP